MSKFIDLLVNKRNEKKLTKKQAADILGWTPMYYGRFENGQLSPSQGNYDRFADFLGISIRELKEIIKEEDKK